MKLYATNGGLGSFNSYVTVDGELKTFQGIKNRVMNCIHLNAGNYSVYQVSGNFYDDANHKLIGTFTK